MINPLFDRFLKRDASSFQKFSDVSSTLLQKYKGEFVSKKDDGFDCIQEIWKANGLSVYQKGLYSLIDPDEFSDIVKQFSSVPSSAIAFAKTASGCVFLWDKEKIGETIFHLNVHKNKIGVASTSFLVFFGVSIGSHDWWKENCYGEIELQSLEKYGTLAYDECYTFIPALALGGDEKVAKMQRVKFKENLNLLSQIHGA